MAGVAERDEALAAELLRRCGDGQGGLVLSTLEPLAPAVRRVAVRAWLGGARGGLRRLGAAHVDAVAACAHSGSRVSLPGGESVTNEHGVLRLVSAPRDDASELAEAIVSLRPGEIVQFGGYEIAASAVEAPGARVPALPAGLDDAVVDADQVAMPLLVRAWRAGDRVVPIGMRGRRKLSDVFIDAKVPRWRRSTLPVVESGGRILWVPGVVRGAGGAVGAYTRRVVRLRADRRSPWPPWPP
jgi:tRNA(Ile)-lysidine synthetase-like protein